MFRTARFDTTRGVATAFVSSTTVSFRVFRANFCSLTSGNLPRSAAIWRKMSVLLGWDDAVTGAEIGGDDDGSVAGEGACGGDDGGDATSSTPSKSVPAAVFRMFVSNPLSVISS